MPYRLSPVPALEQIRNSSYSFEHIVDWRRLGDARPRRSAKCRTGHDGDVACVEELTGEGRPGLRIGFARRNSEKQIERAARVDHVDARGAEERDARISPPPELGHHAHYRVR